MHAHFHFEDHLIVFIIIIHMSLLWWLITLLCSFILSLFLSFINGHLQTMIISLPLHFCKLCAFKQTFWTGIPCPFLLLISLTCQPKLHSRNKLRWHVKLCKISILSRHSMLWHGKINQHFLMMAIISSLCKCFQQQVVLRFPKKYNCSLYWNCSVYWQCCFTLELWIDCMLLNALKIQTPYSQLHNH